MTANPARNQSETLLRVKLEMIGALFLYTGRKSPLVILPRVENHRIRLRYLKAKFRGAEAWQISATGIKDYVSGEGIRVAPAIKFLSDLI